MLGHICSGAAKAALGIYRDAGVIAMSPSATNPELTQSGQYPNFYRTIAPDDAQARIEVDFALDTLKAKKIAVLHDKQDYGRGLAEFAKKFVEASGGRGPGGALRGDHAGRGGLLRGDPEGPPVRRGCGDLRRLSPRGLQAGRRHAQEEDRPAVHLGRRRQGRHLHQGRRRRSPRGSTPPGRATPRPTRSRSKPWPPTGRPTGGDPGAFYLNAWAATAGAAQRHRQGRHHGCGRGRQGAAQRVRRDAAREDPLRRARRRRGGRLRDVPGAARASTSR